MLGIRAWAVKAVAAMGFAVAVGSAMAAGGGSIEGGTISLIGAVVTPTCSLSNSMLANVPANYGDMRYSCQGAQATSASSSQVFELATRALTNNESDRVLNYFNHYVSASRADGSSPQLLTQTYE